MKHRVATTCFVIGAVIGAALVPLASLAQYTNPATPNTPPANPAATNPPMASPSTAAKDSAISEKIKSKLAAEASLKDISVDADQNGAVSMSGTVKSQAEADQAVQIARNTEGVKSVKNNIKVKAGT